MLGLVAAGTGTDYSGDGSFFSIPLSFLAASTAAGEEAFATTYTAEASAALTTAGSDFSAGDYFSAVEGYLGAGYLDVIAGQADTLAALFSAGL